MIKDQKPELLKFLLDNRIFNKDDFLHFIATGTTKPYKSKTTNIEAIFRANSLQQGFVFHYLNQPNDDAYRVQQLLDYHLELNISIYKQAWILASLRYPTLRMAFDWSGKDVLQIITKEAGINDDSFNFVDLASCSNDRMKSEIERIQKEDRASPFDLKKPGLIRFTLMKQNKKLYTCLLYTSPSPRDRG